MPITAKQFELGIDSNIEGWMRKIHSFLASHKLEAFTSVELAKELEGFTFKGAPRRQAPVQYLDEAFQAAVEKLVETRAVDSRVVRGESYYALGHTPLSL